LLCLWNGNEKDGEIIDNPAYKSSSAHNKPLSNKE
jgi:hypothetical protein